jgi:hypothetical protein
MCELERITARWNELDALAASCPLGSSMPKAYADHLSGALACGRLGAD